VPCPTTSPRRFTTTRSATSCTTGEVVADEDAGETVSGLQLDQQVENGCLDGYVQGAGGFVGDE